MVWPHRRRALRDLPCLKPIFATQPVKLHAEPKDGDLCAAFTAWGELVIRRFHPRENGDVRLSTGIEGEVFQVFAPQALMVFGPVIDVERGGKQ